MVYQTLESIIKSISALTYYHIVLNVEPNCGSWGCSCVKYDAHDGGRVMRPTRQTTKKLREEMMPNIRYSIWPGQEVEDSQRSILQPVSEIGGKKLKEKAETSHGTKPERLQVPF